MTIRALLVESDPEYLLFLRDVLIEIEAGRYWGHWVQIDAVDAACWSDAEAILSAQSADVILLDSLLAPADGLEALPPVIALMNTKDETAGTRMIRSGAQDFLMKHEVDCAPLAHAMRNAIERHRLITAARAWAAIDALTGIADRDAFLKLAARDRDLAESLGRRMLVAIAEPGGAGFSLRAGFNRRNDDSDNPQYRDLALLSAADRLRDAAGSIGVLGRIGATRFGLAILETPQEPLEQVQARLTDLCASHAISIGAAVFDPQQPAPLDRLLADAAMRLEKRSFATAQ